MCALPQTSRCRSTAGAVGWGRRGCRSDQSCQALSGSQFETYTLRETETDVKIICSPADKIVCYTALLHEALIHSLGQEHPRYRSYFSHIYSLPSVSHVCITCLVGYISI